MAAESAPGIPLELLSLVTPLPADGGPVPGEIIEHQAHAIGHAAVLLADRGVLLAGDMLSDILIPLLDPRRPGQVGAYETALDRRSCLHRRVAARGRTSRRSLGTARLGGFSGARRTSRALSHQTRQPSRDPRSRIVGEP